MSPDPLTLAYLAGAVDCDGCIQVTFNRRVLSDGAHSRYYVVKVGVTQVDRTIPDLCRATFGGGVYRYESKRNGGKGYWHMWTCSSRQARCCLVALVPHLRQKRAQAECALELIDLIAEQNRRRGAERLTYDDQNERFLLMQRVRRHNARGEAGNNKAILAATSLADFEEKQKLDEHGHKVGLPELDGQVWAQMPERQAVAS